MGRKPPYENKNIVMNDIYTQEALPFQLPLWNGFIWLFYLRIRFEQSPWKKTYLKQKKGNVNNWNMFNNNKKCN